MIALHVPEAWFVLVAIGAHLVVQAALVARQARRRGPPSGVAHDLVYPRAWRIPGIVAGLLLLFFALLVRGRDNPWEGAARVAVALIGAAAILEVLLTRIRLLPDGVERLSPWRAPAFFAWREIQTIDLRLDLGWLALRTRDGASMRVSKRLAGMRTFASIALVHLPRDAFAGDPIARWWLEDRARQERVTG